MTLEAVRRSEETGQPFEQVFSQQWVLSESNPGPLPGFSMAHLGKWGLWYGPSLDVAVAKDEERSIDVAVLGHAVDSEGRFVTDTVVADLLSGASSAEALAASLTMLGGRYAFFIMAPGFERLYLDPSSCLGAVYDETARRAAASLFMAIDRDVERGGGFPFDDIAATGAGGRYAFGLTPDLHVRRLLANHYLDLETFSSRRHWPPPDMDLTCPMTVEAVEERIDTVIRRHHAILNALTTAIRPAMLPVSGGDDSRVLLALSAGMLDAYDLLFVHRANDISRRDVAIACELAALMGIDLRVFDVVEDTDLKRRPRFIKRMNIRRRLAIGLLEGGPDEKRREIEVRSAVPRGGMILRGNVTDVSKAVLWRPVGIAEFLRTGGRHHDPGIGVRLLMLGSPEAERDPWCLAAYEDWMVTLPETARRRALDFASIEHFRTHGQGAFFYSTNRNFYQTPSADRTILEALISLPPHLRDAFYINDRIIERCAPELTGVRFTRKTANDIRARRPPLQEMLKSGPDRL